MVVSLVAGLMITEWLTTRDLRFRRRLFYSRNTVKAGRSRGLERAGLMAEERRLLYLVSRSIKKGMTPKVSRVPEPDISELIPLLSALDTRRR